MGSDDRACVVIHGHPYVVQKVDAWLPRARANAARFVSFRTEEHGSPRPAPAPRPPRRSADGRLKLDVEELRVESFATEGWGWWGPGGPHWQAGPRRPSWLCRVAPWARDADPE